MFGALYWMPAVDNNCKTTCKNNTANAYTRALKVAKHSKNYACGYLASQDATTFWEGTKLVGSDVCSGVAINSNSYLEQYTKSSYHCGCGDGLERWTWTWTCPEKAPYTTWTCRARKQDKTVRLMPLLLPPQPHQLQQKLPPSAWIACVKLDVPLGWHAD